MSNTKSSSHPTGSVLFLAALAMVLLPVVTAVGCGDNHTTPAMPDAPQDMDAPIDAPAGKPPTLEVTRSSSLGTFNGIEYTEHECRFAGTTADGIAYDMNCWLIAPAKVADTTGLVLLDLFNTVNLAYIGEARVAFARLGRDFLLNNGFMYAGIRWDRTAIDHPKRQSPGRPADVLTPASARRTVGYDILIAFARALRDDPTAVQHMGTVKHLISYGYSQSAAIQRMLFLDQPALFDGALVGGAGARGLRMESLIDADRTEFFIDRREPPADKGKVIQLDGEGDALVIESLDVRSGPRDVYRKYEIAGASHLKRAVCQAVGFPAADTANPLDWDPVSRALLLALRDWVIDGTEPPEERLLDNIGSLLRRDSNGNALGGIRLPEVAAGRGQYIGYDLDYPLGTGCDLAMPARCPDEFRQVCGTFVDRLCTNYPDLDDYVNAITGAADELVSERFLLAADRDKIVADAARLRDDPNTCP